ncbi:hypothetical protein DQ04_22871000, partial [Trypanosoma grayi]|uniref:hypothetical protein n=1 Tax=Trypanosoma grayi TaxID=71804 RepID=UPI0004F3F00B
AKAPGPTRAAALKALQEWAETLGVEAGIDSEAFLAQLGRAIAELRAASAPLKKQIAALQDELDGATSTLSTCSEQVAQILATLRRVHLTEETTTTTAEASPGSALQATIAALRSESEWSAEKILSHAELTRRMLGVFEPVCSGRGVLEACVRTVEELQERRSTESAMRAELAAEREQLEMCRRCIEESLRAMPKSLLQTDGDELPQRCAAAAARLRQLTGVLSSVQERIALEGLDTHANDVVGNLDDILRTRQRQNEQVKVLEASSERGKARLQQLEQQLQAADTRAEAAVASHEEATREAQQRAREQQAAL